MITHEADIAKHARRQLLIQDGRLSVHEEVRYCDQKA